MYDDTRPAMPAESAWLRSPGVKSAYQAGLRAWPGISLSEDEFAQHLTSVLPAGADGIPPGLHSEDLFLACGCAKGDPRAIEHFSTRVLSIIPLVVARMSASPAFLEELTQDMRELLLVGRSDSPPRIGEYRGTGSLVAWVRISATRAAIRRLKREQRVTPTKDADMRAIAPVLGPELEYLRERYRPVIESALRQALDGLATRDRDVLRHHFVGGLTIDELGERYGVHRATAARWVAAARDRLLVATRDAARERLRSTDAEVDSLMRLVASQLELSIRSLGDA
jgi:RNA polymerase sigma-70 factor (ECF subfamily)